jgi:hypothetical protein
MSEPPRYRRDLIVPESYDISEEPIEVTCSLAHPPEPRGARQHLIVGAARGGDSGSFIHCRCTSNVMPVARSETFQRVAMASGFRERPNIGRRTGAPQFTHRGV